ncbi:MAG: hypothetical protein M1834_003277 [Cirrosporium novae-zelandiae]|nr:MAG: hypothetical protein M1834_003277 [Cirrosporium novae-zelandiae]
MRLLQGRTKRFRLLLAAVITIIVLAIVIPIAVVFGRKHTMPPKSNVLVPLYVYPAPGAWDPLYKVIETYPHVKFIVVVNPNSGPGSTAVPDANYTSAIPKLTSHSNVRLLGYVATTYAQRNFSAVLEDVRTYAEWSNQTSYPGLSVSGIFFDEAPSVFNESHFQYLSRLKSAVKSYSGLGPDNLVILNPGTIPATQYLSLADSTVVFEERYSTYRARNSYKELRAVHEGRSRKTILMHSVPDSLTLKEDRDLVHDMRRVGANLFLTHLASDYYARFDPKWSEFIRYMSE